MPQESELHRVMSDKMNIAAVRTTSIISGMHLVGVVIPESLLQSSRELPVPNKVIV